METGEVETEEASIEVEVSTVVQEKCIKQHVQNVTKNVKFLPSQQKANLYIAGIVFRNINLQEDFSS